MEETQKPELIQKKLPFMSRKKKMKIEKLKKEYASRVFHLGLFKTKVINEKLKTLGLKQENVDLTFKHDDYEERYFFTFKESGIEPAMLVSFQKPTVTQLMKMDSDNIKTEYV